MLKLSILKLSAFALLVSLPMGLRAEVTPENASQLNILSASSAQSLSPDTHSDIEAVSVLSDAELKDTQGAFWPVIFWVAQTAFVSCSLHKIIGPGASPFAPKPLF